MYAVNAEHLLMKNLDPIIKIECASCAIMPALIVSHSNCCACVMKLTCILHNRCVFWYICYMAIGHVILNRYTYFYTLSGKPTCCTTVIALSTTPWGHDCVEIYVAARGTSCIHKKNCAVRRFRQQWAWHEFGLQLGVLQGGNGALVALTAVSYMTRVYAYTILLCMNREPPWLPDTIIMRTASSK